MRTCGLPIDGPEPSHWNWHLSSDTILRSSSVGETIKNRRRGVWGQQKHYWDMTNLDVIRSNGLQQHSLFLPSTQNDNSLDLGTYPPHPSKIKHVSHFISSRHHKTAVNFIHLILSITNHSLMCPSLHPIHRVHIIFALLAFSHSPHAISMPQPTSKQNNFRFPSKKKRMNK